MSFLWPYYYSRNMPIYIYIFFLSDSMENTLYDDKGAGLKFALLNIDLANQFPVEKIKLLKFIIQCKFFFYSHYLDFT